MNVELDFTWKFLNSIIILEFASTLSLWTPTYFLTEPLYIASYNLLPWNWKAPTYIPSPPLTMYSHPCQQLLELVISPRVPLTNNKAWSYGKSHSWKASQEMNCKDMKLRPRGGIFFFFQLWMPILGFSKLAEFVIQL